MCVFNHHARESRRIQHLSRALATESRQERSIAEILFLIRRWINKRFMRAHWFWGILSLVCLFCGFCFPFFRVFLRQI